MGRRKMTDAEPAGAPAQGPAKKPPSDPLKIGHVTRHLTETFNNDNIVKAFGEHVAALAAKHEMGGYTILYLLDVQDNLQSWHSNRIYRAASEAKREKPIL